MAPLQSFIATPGRANSRWNSGAFGAGAGSGANASRRRGPRNSQEQGTWATWIAGTFPPRTRGTEVECFATVEWLLFSSSLSLTRHPSSPARTQRHLHTSQKHSTPHPGPHEMALRGVACARSWKPQMVSQMYLSCRHPAMRYLKVSGSHFAIARVSFSIRIPWHLRPGPSG